MKLAIYHLTQKTVESKFRTGQSKVHDWLVNDSTLTIFLTVFNQTHEELERSITSARVQSGAKIKIVIFDDGSTLQETLTFLNNFMCHENEVLIRSQNKGVISARNELIDLATTDFLLFLDPDDELNSGYVSEAFAFLEKDRSIEIIYPNVLVNDIVLRKITLWETGPFDPDVLKEFNTLPMSSIISTRLIRQLGGFSKDFQTGPEDWDLWVRAAMSGVQARHLPNIGYKYSLSPNSRSSAATDHSDLIQLRAIGKNLHLPLNMKNTIDVFLTVPWLPRIGGVEKYVKCLMEDLKLAGLLTALVITEPDPIDYEDDSSNYREMGNLVVKRVDFPSDDLFLVALKRLASPNSVSINFGSPWAFENNLKLDLLFYKQVCFIFNTEISLTRAIKAEKNFDEFWLAYEKIGKNLPKKIQSKSRTIYTGVVPNPPKNRIEANNPTFTVGFLGRYSPEKNPDAFLDLAKAAENDQEFRFLIAGEGPLEQRVREKVAALKNVANLGFQSDTTTFFADLDCLVISSDIEGIPLSAIEALSLGIPVLSRPVGGMSELLENDRDGFIWKGSSAEGVELLRKLRERKSNHENLSRLDEKFLRSSTSSLVTTRIQELINYKSSKD